MHIAGPPESGGGWRRKSAEAAAAAERERERERGERGNGKIRLLLKSGFEERTMVCQRRLPPRLLHPTSRRRPMAISPQESRAAPVRKELQIEMDELSEARDQEREHRRR